MKLAINLTLPFITFFILSGKSYSLTDYKIKKICKKEIRQSKCINNLQEKRTFLQKGKPIEIPVKPYKR